MVVRGGRHRARHGIGTLLGALAITAVPRLAEARKPLPAVEVVSPEPKPRLRSIDVRMPARVGFGYSSLWDDPVYAAGLEAHVSFLELSQTTFLHASFGESALLSAPPMPRGTKRPSLVGADAGLGLSRFATGGPAFVVTLSAGPRWTFDREDFVPDGVGVVGRAEVYPFYASISEITKSRRGWFRKYVASGLHLWVSARYDALRDRHGNTYAAGVGLDLGRSVLLPILARL